MIGRFQVPQVYTAPTALARMGWFLAAAEGMCPPGRDCDCPSCEEERALHTPPVIDTRPFSLQVWA